MGLLDRGVRLRRLAAARPQRLKAPERVTLPLLFGETPLVQAGEPVLLGQRVADGPGDTVPLHAPVSGTVAEIRVCRCADGRRLPAILLDNDGRDAPDPALRSRALADELTDEALLTLLFDAGLRLPDGRPLAAAIAGARRLVFSAMDQEPGQYVQDAAILYDGEAVRGGMRLLERLVKPEVTVLALWAGQRAALRRARDWGLKPTVLPEVYPGGHPRQLERLAGPEDKQTLVLPVSAAADCARAVYEGTPVVRQSVSVENRVYWAAIGTPLSEILAEADAEAPVLLGGAMTGTALEYPDAPLVRGLTALTPLAPEAPPEVTACIRCGRCAAVCPEGLRPWRGLAPPERQRCLRCGACRYSCPAGKALP